MGAGRKTSTYDIDTKAASAGYVAFESRQRNLGEALGGCIFGCTNDTIEECLTDLVFGLPKGHWCYVQWIAEGMPIFLYNYSSRKLHGIFKAVTDGGYEIKPDGWCKGSGTRTQYPAQCKVEVYAQCEPLTDREYKPIIKECIVADEYPRFTMLFELKKAEAQQLCRAFDEKTNGRRATNANMPNATGANTALARENKKPFRPASPPAIPAWGQPASSQKAEKSPPTASDFPSLGRSTTATQSPASPDKSSSGAAAIKAAEAKAAEAAQKAAAKKAEEEQKKKAAEAAERRRAALASAAKPASEASKEPITAAPQSQGLSKKSKSDGNATPPTIAAPAANKSASQAMNYLASQLDSAKLNSQPGPVPTPQPAERPAVISSAQASQNPSAPSSSGNFNRQEAAAPVTANSVPPSNLANGNVRPNPVQEGRLPDAVSQEMGNARTAATELEFDKAVDSMYRALSPVNEGAAREVQRLFNVTKGRLARATQDRITLARALDNVNAEKEQLDDLVQRQSQHIQALRQETQELRTFLSNVGAKLGFQIAPFSTVLSSLPSLQATHAQEGAQALDYGRTNGRAQSQSVENHDVGMVDAEPINVRNAPALESLLMFGGHNGKQWLNTIDSFSPSSKSWNQLQTMPDSRGYAAAAAVGPSVYIMGGGVGKQWFNSVLRFDVDDGNWYEMSSMSEERGSLAAASVGGKLYAVGGGRPGVQSDLVEILDPAMNEWIPGKRLHSKRFATAAGVIGNAVHAVGGFCENRYLTSAERYDPREGFWSLLPEMENRRGGHSVVAVGNDLYAMGGWNNELFMDNVEVYDARANAWRSFPRLKTPHAYFAAAQLDGSLYVLGGMQEQKAFNSLVEYYDSAEGKWKALYIEPSDQKDGHQRAFIASCKCP